MPDVNSPEVELPRAIALAWGVSAHPQRGPKRELTTERVVEAAVEIADAGGLPAVSMAAVASSLGFTTMALYRYVAAKDDLVLLMQEQATGLPPEPLDGDGRPLTGWREGLRHWAAGQVAVYRRHRWVLDLPIQGVPVTPNSLAWLESGLDLLRGTGLDPGTATAVVLAVMAQTRFQGLVEAGYVRAAQAQGTSPDDLDVGASGLILQLLTDAEFPRVLEAAAAGVFGPEASDPFAFGLERVLDGVEQVVAGAVTDPAPTPTDPPEVLGDKAVREAAKKVREATKQLRDARRDERRALEEARRR